MTFATTKTVGEIAAETPGAMRQFEKFGIDYCCGGGRTLADACSAAHVELATVVFALERDATAPKSKQVDWRQESLVDLIAHIKSTHHVFVQTECPRIYALAEKVNGKHGGNHPELETVQETFSALAAELAVHLMKEEQILFPYVELMEESVIAGEPAPPSMFGTVQNPIRMMEHEHDSAGAALQTLRTATNDYRVPEGGCMSYRALYEALIGFEADLHQHIHLENNILFPRAAAMEGRK